jgi:hypothetical protein
MSYPQCFLVSRVRETRTHGLNGGSYSQHRVRAV